jgi:hypothetical protein
MYMFTRMWIIFIIHSCLTVYGHICKHNLGVFKLVLKMTHTHAWQHKTNKYKYTMDIAVYKISIIIIIIINM